jgi:hypothetical protein
MSRPTCAAICLLLFAVSQGARGGVPEGLHEPATSAVDVRALLDCRWSLSFIRGCPRLTHAITDGISPSASTGYTGGADYEGIKRDTYYFLGLQLSIVGALYFMPESVSGWSEQQKEQHRADKWWSNVTDPTWDDDEHYINYVLHPYWGAAYYVRARERGYGARESFWYSVLLSTLYETGVEAMFEPVSIQDFFVTPIVGSWLGEYFMDWRRATHDRIAKSGEARFRDKALLVATDPLGNAADFVDRRLGRDVEFGVMPFVIHQTPVPSAAFAPRPRELRGATYGLTLTLRW